MTARDTAFAPPGTRAEIEEGTALTPRFDRDGLVACIAVDARDGQVLMLAHMALSLCDAAGAPSARGALMAFSAGLARLVHIVASV